MISRILTITLPIFFIVIAGFLYGKIKKPNMSEANQISIDLALPCLIFTSLSAKQFNLNSSSLFVLASGLVIALTGLLILPLAKYSETGFRALSPSAMFANVGPIGIPLTLLAFGNDGLAPTVLLLVFSNILHFSLGIGIMSGKLDTKLVYKSPLVWATVVGVLFSYLHLSLPEFLSVPLTMVGNILVPMMLLSLGVRLSESKIEYLRVGIIGSTLSIVCRLAVTCLVLLVIPLEPLHKGALVLFAGLPPAVFNYMIADRYNQEPDKVASIVIVGHLLSLLVLPLVLWVALSNF